MGEGDEEDDATNNHRAQIDLLCKLYITTYMKDARMHE